MEARQVLALAVEKEEAAAELYEGMAAEAGDPALQALLTDMASEEHKHREALLAVDPADLSGFEPEERESLGLAEFLEPRPISPGARLQEAFVYAMHREQEASAFYARMAEGVRDRELQGLFRKLATMETGHKARLEEMYESTFLGES